MITALLVGFCLAISCINIISPLLPDLTDTMNVSISAIRTPGLQQRQMRSQLRNQTCVVNMSLLIHKSFVLLQQHSKLVLRKTHLRRQLYSQSIRAFAGYVLLRNSVIHFIHIFDSLLLYTLKQPLISSEVLSVHCGETGTHILITTMKK